MHNAKLFLVAPVSKWQMLNSGLAKAIYNLQKKAPARTDFHQFADRSHFLAGEKGWEEVANYALDWAEEVTKPASIH